jgi:hypothetical protein
LRLRGGNDNEGLIANRRATNYSVFALGKLVFYPLGKQDACYAVDLRPFFVAEVRPVWQMGNAV